MDRAAAELSEFPNVTFANGAYETCQGADALIILTEWREFAEMDLTRVRSMLRLPILIDGKNVIAAEKAEAAGLAYYGVGRKAGPSHPNRRKAFAQKQ